MPYRVFLPAPALQPCIGFYWLLSGYRPQQELVTLLPDGTISLVLNLGEDIYSLGFQQKINHEGLFLVGTTLCLEQQHLHGECHLFGIQFRPGGFTHFYPDGLLAQSANSVQEFSPRLFPDVKKIVEHFIPYVNQFYLDRLSPPRHSLLQIVADIEQVGGQLKIATLTKNHFITERQLERQFQQQVGVSPKEFSSLIRFRTVLDKIQRNPAQRSLADLAWECGYYDHAHLTNDFRRYAGVTPTGLILSDFSKMLVNASL